MKRFGLSCLAVLLALTTCQIAAAKGGKMGGKIGGKKAPETVKDKLFAKIDANYKDRLEKSRLDPAKNDGIRQQIKADKDRISKSYVKFEGKTPGWEVSIIDEEFVPNNNEYMLIYQEVKQKRYFFFNGASLFKRFFPFDKEVVRGKTIPEFGKMMQAKFGKAQPVYRTVVLRGQKDNVLDTYLWRSSEGDGLRLVDRSKFYDVYCLVVYD